MGALCEDFYLMRFSAGNNSIISAFFFQSVFLKRQYWTW